MVPRSWEAAGFEMTERVTFDQAYSRLSISEAGFQNDPADKGNWTGGRVGVGENKGTNGGISAATYPDLDIRNLKPDQIKAIYYRDWWLKAGGDHFDPAIVFQLWEFAVLAGMDNAKRCLQRAARVADDGEIGDVSIAAVCAMDLNDVLFRFNAAKLRHFTQLTTFDKYGRGWTNRTADRLDDCALDNIDLPETLKWNYSRPSFPGSSQLPESPLASSASGNPASPPQKPTPPSPLLTPSTQPTTQTGSFLQMIGQILKFGKR
jgi:hypothetical protein